MNLLSYLAYQAANVLMVLWLPNDAKIAFLQAWSIGTGSSSLLVMLCMSRDGWGARVYALALAALAAAAWVVAPRQSFWFLFALLAVATDYLLSLGTSDWERLAGRLLVLGLTLGFVSGALSLNELAGVRIAVAGGLVLLLLGSGRKLRRLRVKQPLTYVLLTHGGYYGPLTALPWVAEGRVLKAAYVAYQILGNLCLKYFDFRIRGERSPLPRRLAAGIDVVAVVWVLASSGWFGLRVGVLVAAGYVVLRAATKSISLEEERP